MTEATAAATTATTATTAATTAETAASTATAETNTAATFDWSKNGFEGDDLGYIQNKGFAGPKDAIVAYRNLETMLGADKATLLKLPKDDNPEAMREIYTKLGMPEKPEGYQIQVPEGQTNELATAAPNWFHKAGLTKKQADIVVGELNTFTAAQAKAEADANTAKAAEALTALKTEWGAAWDQNTALIDKAAEKFGMSPDELAALRDAMGPAKAMKFMHSIGSKLGAEDGLPAGDPNSANFKLTPDAAKNQIAALKNDPDWVKRFLAGGAAEVAESDRLHKMAYPES